MIAAVTDRERSEQYACHDLTDPLDALARHRVDKPVVVLHSAPADSRWSQRSVIATPETYLTVDRHGAHWSHGKGLFEIGDGAASPLDVLQRAIDNTCRMQGLWIGYLSYDLGRCIEPKAQAPNDGSAAVDDRHWPVLEFAWCPGAMMREHGSRDVVPCSLDNTPAPSVGELQPALTRDQYCASVETIIEAIAAGDIFQANFTQRFTAAFHGSSRALASAALQRSGAWFGAYLELPGGRTICSLSPELFVHFDSATRCVTTRPIKGTRPEHTDPCELLHSEKDLAELNMIIDLMRNDLGRVCAFGSVRVPQPRIIESHAGVHHGVGKIVGTMRPHCTIADLLRATMPAGSITGAPKIRAMQIIDQLEPVRRGPYCGAIGVIDPAGDTAFNVAIRTMSMTDTRAPGRVDVYEQALLDYGAGGGIVADSIPDSEYQEMLDKTSVLRAAVKNPAGILAG